MAAESTPEFGRRATPPGSMSPPPPSQPEPTTSPATPTASPKSSGRSRASRSQFVIFMNFLMSLAVIVAVGAAIYTWFDKTRFNSPGPTSVAKTFEVKDGVGWKAISSQLESQGLIADASTFRRGAQASGGGDPKVGEYAIPAGASMRQIVGLLQSGKSIMQSLTIPEGLTVQQAWDRIAASDALVGDMPTEMPPEGSLAADTQRFTRGTERKAVVAKMLADQKALVDEIWAKRAPNLPIADINEFVTLASIVEKETGIASERPHVASVFVNRLNQGMRLQSDPTILYGLFGGKGRPADRPIYQSDIQKPTPYNTYTIDGLPPGPIANPGRAALEAVANPLDTKDLFFVADGTGGHVFAATLQEHNKNVAKWRTAEKAKQNGAQAPDAAPAQ